MSERESPLLLSAEPDSIHPGDVVALRWAPGSLRGIGYFLTRADDPSSEPLYFLKSDGAGWKPTWLVRGELWFCEDIGVMRLAPDHVVMPPSLAPGRYRISTANTPGVHSAEIEVIQ